MIKTNISITKRTSILLYCIILFSYNGFTLFAQNAVIKEEYKEFKTYAYSDPNPIANEGIIYPYFRFDGYSTSGKPQKWKVVTLENPFIKVFVTPEIGGKIWGALDKATGKMFIYNNDVVKFRNIAMRGPWTSGGIEFNFGIIGHAPTGSSPVDYILKENSDGSVSCIIGALDLITETSWRVEIRLPKDKAFFETKVLWHNNTALNQPYYHWMTGAAKATDDLEFYFPGHSFLNHEGKRFAWPIDEEGHDLSKYAENNFGTYKSFHILGDYSGYFGGYYFNDQLGFGNWSTYTDKPGKKLWIWGLSRQGMIWEDLLTDNGGQYIEMQTGRLFNQEAEESSKTPFKHRDFPAFGTDTWNEIWFPLKETEGMKSASKIGVINLEALKDQTKIYFSPLQNIDDDITIKHNGKTIFTEHLNLKPLELYTHTIDVESTENIQVNIGEHKLNYSLADEQKNALNRPLITPLNFDWNSVQGLAIKGKEAVKILNLDEAIKSYSECLEKDPNFLDALVGIAEVYYRNMKYDTALNYAKRALAINAYDGAGNFIYGLINRKSNFAADAKDGFSIAAHSIEFRSAAFTELAEMYASEGDWTQGTTYANKALDFNRYNLTAYQVLVISQRKQKQLSESEKTIDAILTLDPLNHFARFEKYLNKKENKKLMEFKGLIRNELPHETYLDLAVTYYKLNLIPEAVEVLDNAPENAIISYWKAYLQHLLSENRQSSDFLNIAKRQSPELIFPFREETLKVINWAATQDNNWKENYYTGLIYRRYGNTEKANELFMACKQESDYAPFYLTRAKAFQSIDVSQAIIDVQTAIKLDKKNWRAWILLSKLYEQNGEYQNSFKVVKTIYKQNPNDYRFAIPYAKALYRFEKYKECIAVLNKTEVLPFEGASGVRNLFHEAHIMSAIKNMQKNKLSNALEHLKSARLWPENLGAGKPYDPNEITEDYLEMLIREQMNDSEESVVLQQKIKNYLEQIKSANITNTIIEALISRKDENNKEAISLLEVWNDGSPENSLAQWVLAIFSDDNTKEKLLSEKVKNNPSNRIYYEIVIIKD